MTYLKNPSNVINFLNSNPDFQGILNVKLYPDYQVDAEVLESLKTLLVCSEEDLIRGNFFIKDKKIQVKTNFIDWNENIVDFVFPDMGKAIQDEKFRHDSSLAITINVEAGQSFAINTLFTPISNVSCIVAWGDLDNQIEIVTGQSDFSHTYETAGKYTIFIKGMIYDTTRNPGIAKENSIEVIHFIKPHIFSNSLYTFCNLPNLTDIIGKINLASDASGINHIFYESKNIKNFKGLNIIIPNKHKITSIKQMFGGSLNETNMDFREKSFDDFRSSLVNFDKNSITNIDNSFWFSNITKLPLKWFGKNVTNAYQAFKNCPKLEKINKNIFENLEDAHEMFYCDTYCLPNDKAAPIHISKDVKFPSIKKASGMFGNRVMTFEEIKQFFESLPANPNPYKGIYGFNKFDGSGVYGDDVSIGNYAITFCFDPNEENIREKITDYFKLNSEDLIKAHMNYNSNLTSEDWDGGWYPIYNTYYGHTWCYNLPNGWAVNFRLPHNYNKS